jgi:hypothetical protein
MDALQLQMAPVYIRRTQGLLINQSFIKHRRSASSDLLLYEL